MYERIDKSAAAYTLSDELMGIGLKLERADIVMQDICDEYFGTLTRDIDKMSDRDKLSICWGFSRYGKMAEIVFDYLIAIRHDMEALDKLVREGGDKVGAEREKAS